MLPFNGIDQAQGNKAENLCWSTGVYALNILECSWCDFLHGWLNERDENSMERDARN